MSFRSTMTKIDDTTHRGLGAIGRPAAVAGATYVIMDKGIPAITMAVTGDPRVLSEPTKIGVSVLTAGAVEAVLHFSATDSETLREQGEKAAERFSARAAASEKKKDEKDAAAA